MPWYRLFPLQTYGLLATGVALLGCIGAGVAARAGEGPRARDGERERLQALLDALPQPMWTARPDGTVEVLNARFRDCFGVPVQDSLGSAGLDLWNEVVHPDDQERVLGTWRHSVAADVPFELEARLRVSGGEPRWHVLRGSSQKDSRGHVVRWLAEAVELETREVPSEDAARVKDEFVAMLSHELRTPLHAMLGWAALLQRGGLSAAKQERALDAITRNVRAQSRIVDDLLDLSDIVTGNLRLRMERVELVDVIQGALETIRPAAEAKGVALAVDVSPQAGAVSGDANRLRQVMWNLLSNAVRFTPPSGRIDVRARRAESSAILEVGDTGSGIPAEELPRVFERFWQLDSSRTRAHGGLGLGLAIVRYLVEAHGGSVSAHSEGRGRGALFVVELPSHAVTRSVDVPRQQDRPERSAPDAAPSLAGVRALVVEDDPESQDLLRTILEQAGARVTAARRAREALEASRCQAFDVVISDIGMPETNGHAFLKLLRARLPAPAIALTAFASASEADQARRAGYERHLAKPIDFGRVVDSVREVVAEYRAARLLP